MSQEAAARPEASFTNFDGQQVTIPKVTYKHFCEVLSAYWSGDRVGGSLIDTLYSSPRLTQWAKVAEGYRIWSTDETMSVTITPVKMYTTKGSRSATLGEGLPATTLYNSILTAQGIVQRSGADEPDEDYFAEGVDFSDGAGLDAALEETHAAPLAEDDAELIEDVTAEEALNADQRKEDGPTPVITVSQKFIEDITPKPVSFTEQANRQNSVTDGVICTFCGNLNPRSYRDACPQCPPQQAKAIDKAVGKTAKTMQNNNVSRLKSLQGRILTIIDGSFSDKTQRDAVKQLINKEFRRDIGNAATGGINDTGIVE